MTEKDRLAKEAYFHEQDLLDLSDDERNFPKGCSDIIERALSESREISSSFLERSNSFLGPPPKYRQAEFKRYTTTQRAAVRQTIHQPIRPATAPEPITTENSTNVRSRRKLPSNSGNMNGRTLRTASSLSSLRNEKRIPFYIEMGSVPRELKRGKNVKPANNIKLEPENRQLLKKKVIYFYPNDDICQARRTRIHKVIQLGAAWVNRWRDDITHVMIDDTDFTYTRLLKHLNVAGLPVRLPLTLGLQRLTA